MNCKHDNQIRILFFFFITSCLWRFLSRLLFVYLSEFKMFEFEYLENIFLIRCWMLFFPRPTSYFIVPNLLKLLERLENKAWRFSRGNLLFSDFMVDDYKTHFFTVEHFYLGLVLFAINDPLLQSWTQTKICIRNQNFTRKKLNVKVEIWVFFEQNEPKPTFWIKGTTNPLW